MTTGLDNFTILDSWPPDSFERQFTECFYHSLAYLQGQPEKPSYSFFLTLPESKKILAMIHFYRRDRHAISQLYAPFGSFVSGSLTKEIARHFLVNIVETLSKEGFGKISIHHPAPCYQFHATWQELLVESKFTSQSTTNHHLVVDHQPLKQKFHQMEKRKLAKCGGFKFNILPIHLLGEVYQFILSCRIQKSQKLSLTYERLEQVVSNASENFLLCTVFSGEKIAAASIVIKVSTNCWYQFYPAHDRQFDRESPLVLLLSELYQYARSNGVRIIDLGTSQLNDQPLEGLLNFKHHLGGIATSKTLYSKSLLN